MEEARITQRVSISGMKGWVDDATIDAEHDSRVQAELHFDGEDTDNIALTVTHRYERDGVEHVRRGEVYIPRAAALAIAHFIYECPPEKSEDDA